MEYKDKNPYEYLFPMKKKLKKKPTFEVKGETFHNELTGNELWNEYAANITPLDNKNRCSDVETSKSFIRRQQNATGRSADGMQSLYGLIIPTDQQPNFSHGAAAGLDRRSAQKIRRGKVRIEASHDLHGMIKTEAHTSLLDFLEHAYLSGKRSVLVITGKGTSLNGEIGVLRQVVPKWLNEKPMKNWIRGFDKAAPADGGEGALYILLKRKQ